MGLDTSHDCFHGPYSAFTRWRTHVAEAAGFELETVQDGPFTHKRAKVIPWDTLPLERYQGEWPEMPADPLWILLAHSDCDGEIKAEHCGPIADRLEALIPSIDINADFGTLRARTIRFVMGLRKAAAAGEPVDFH